MKKWEGKMEGCGNMMEILKIQNLPGGVSLLLKF